MADRPPFLVASPFATVYATPGARGSRPAPPPPDSIIGEARQGDEAVCAIAAEQPDVVIAGSDLPGIPIVPLVREVRAAHPVSQIVVVGRLRLRAEHAELTTLGIRGFVLWKDVDAESLGAILELARRGMRVASDAAMERRDTPEPETERRLRSGVALGCGAPLHSPWRRSARGLPCDRRRRRRQRIPLF